MTTHIQGAITPQAIALTFGSISILYGLRGILTPTLFAREFGFPPDAMSASGQPTRTPPNKRDPFVTATGGRTVALGLAVFVLAWETQLKAAGTVLGCCAISGLSDTVGCYAAGASGAVVQHAIGTIVLGCVGFWLRGVA
ncbi:hypothetical protein LTR70_003128 [Exophiala xenobiotica]|uniref:Uncharacterized protein n=1 Tax=Lithohypha guttulata TaxID=1690604 RepID=A0ABR0KHH2_9EURO|nr:hypothetical protein LTR24_002640 [Lithohypha guttulata]KAK5323839.1 hypothetical protein LTR70_003128 [Exophiala xenobiotica]